jgi:hypothetical protein
VAFTPKFYFSDTVGLALHAGIYWWGAHFRAQLEFERGEFDIVGLDDNDRESLLVEAKARVDGSDSLTSLRTSFLTAATDPAHVIANGNHRRKWDHLCRVVQNGPVDVLLVASGARWWFRAARDGAVMRLEPAPRQGV